MGEFTTRATLYVEDKSDNLVQVKKRIKWKLEAIKKT